MTIPNIPDFSEKDFDSLSEEDKIIEAALQEAREQEFKLQQKLKELVTRQNAIKRNLANVTPITASAKFDDTSKIVTIKFSNTRNDLTEFMRSLRSRSYDWSTTENKVNVSDYDKLTAFVEKSKNISIEMDDISSSRLAKYRETPNVDIWDDGRVIRFKLHEVYPSDITQLLKNVSNVAGKVNQYSINRSDAYQILDVISYCESHNLKYGIIPDVLEYAKKQANDRNILKELALLSDTDYDVKIACGYELEPLQKVAAKFIEISGKVIVADPMGMGKSLESLAPAIKNNWRTLIVCPAFLVDNWISYILSYTGQMPYVMEGTTPADHVMIDLLTDKKQYNIINYEALSRPISIPNPNSTSWKDKTIERNIWVEMLNASKFDYIISDEAHYIKNIDSARSKAVRAITGEREAFLTGTPLLNRPKELFPMLNTLYPNEFPSQKAFEDAYCDGANGAKNVEALREILANIMIRRKNPKIANINSIPVYLRLSESAKKRYDRVLEGIFETVTGGRYDVTNVLVELMRLKQICADDTVPNTVEQAIEARSSYDEDEKHNGVLIFSQFIESAHTIYSDLVSEGNNVALIEGATDMGTRTKIVADFQAGKYDFLVGTKAMGEGLNITRAGTVIFNDLLWNKAGHDQFSGRAFGRTGDHHGGNEYWMLKKNTLIDDIYALIGSKEFTSKQVVDGEFIHDRDESSVVNAIIRKIKES